MITAAQFLRVVGALVRLNFSTGKDRACVRAHLRRCLYTADLQKRLTHTVTHTRKRADGSSGNRDVKEYFNSSENDQKRLENNIFRIFLLFVISRSGVRVRLPAPIFPQRSKLNMGEFPSGQRGQTVNLLSVTSVVRIHLPPPKQSQTNQAGSPGFCSAPTVYMTGGIFVLVFPLAYAKK